jgi:hypothetical protein
LKPDVTDYQLNIHGRQTVPLLHGIGFTAFTDFGIGAGWSGFEAFETALYDLEKKGWDVESLRTKIMANELKNMADDHEFYDPNSLGEEDQFYVTIDVR